VPASEAARLDILTVVLAYLTPRQRAVVHLIYWEGLSARKVGTLLGMDHKTVARVHAAAVAELRWLYGVEEKCAA
jgi:DNA-directed RNA polymerase specialized sigma24 family protein